MEAFRSLDAEESAPGDCGFFGINGFRMAWMFDMGTLRSLNGKTSLRDASHEPVIKSFHFTRLEEKVYKEIFLFLSMKY